MLPEKLKKLVPYPAKRVLSKIRVSFEGIASPLSQELRFRRYYSTSPREADCQKLRARLIFHAHSLEKGLSHTDLRLGFGQQALTQLAENMHRYRDLGCDEADKAFVNALSVLNAYVRLHRNNSYPLDNVETLFGPLVQEASTLHSTLGGVVTVAAKEKADNRQKNFAELFRGRTSVREYSDTLVDLSLVEEAIEIAMKSPSVCNRQSYRVRILTDATEIAAALHLQGGMTGYQRPPVLLVITTDIRNFIALTERNQSYVDGGLFAMALLLGLEHVGLAACPLNTMFSRKREQAARSLLEVEHENFIMFIAVGNFADAVAAPKSFRYTANDRIL